MDKTKETSHSETKGTNVCRTPETLLRGMVRAVGVTQPAIQVNGSSNKKSRTRRPSVARTAPTLTARMVKIVRRYVLEHSDRLTKYALDEKRWIVAGVSGECAGRLQREGVINYDVAPGWSLAIPITKLKSYAANRGISASSLTQWANKAGVRQRRAAMARHARSRSCYVIPLNGEMNFQLCNPANFTKKLG